MKRPSNRGKANPQPKTFVQKYRIGKGGNVDKIPLDDTGICECTRYCQGGKLVDGATFRRHYGKSIQDSRSRKDPVPREGTTTVDAGTTCPLVENLANIPGPSIPILLDWFHEHGIWIHESLEVRQMPDAGGVAVFAVGVGSPQQVVCKIPRSAILSIHTTALVSLLPRKTRTQLPPIVLLSLSLLYELRLGPESRYWGYLQSLPRRHVPIVALWDVDAVGGADGKAARGLVAGTAVDEEVRRVKKDGHGMEDLALYHRATADAFPITNFSLDPPTFLDMLYTYSLVSSRAFQVDVYHGAAIVPLADAFNHQEINNVCFESDDFVCEECGSLPTCEHDEIEGIEPRHEVDTDPSATPETISIASRLSHLPLEIIRSLFDPRQNTLDLTVKTPYEPGQEVFNTYGEGMGWAKQACEWGFIDASIEGDGALGRGLKWELGDVLERDSEDYQGAKKAWKTRCERNADGGEKQELEAEQVEGSIDDQDVQADSLFFSPPPNEPAKDNLLLNEDGQISYPLFWALVCQLQPALKDTNSDARKLDALARAVQQSEDVANESPLDGGFQSNAYDPDMGRLARHVVALFERRIARTCHPAQTAAELCDMLDKLSETDHYLTRMALKILIAERSVLEAAIARWQEIAGIAGTGVA